MAGDGRDHGDAGSDRSIDLEWVSDRDDLIPTRRRRSGRIGAALVALVCVLAVAVAIVATRSGGDDHESTPRDTQTIKTPAGRALVAALGTTTASGSWNTTNEFRVTSGSQPEGCSDSGSGSGAARVCTYSAMRDVTVSGRSTINTDPFRMVAVSEVSGLGAITTSVDGTRIWEDGGGNYGITSPGSGPGGPIAGFAGLVMGTLGPGPGALTMLTLASPTGYLNLQEQAVVGVTASGTGTVGGTPVTYYDVTVEVEKLLDVPGLTPEQSEAISQAIAQLHQTEYRGTNVKVGVDADGFIRETTSVSEFGNGARITSHTILSNFGCAGLVALPGEPPPPPPPPCAPAGAAEPTTTSTAPAVAPTPTPLDSTTTTLAGGSSSTTTPTRPPANESATTGSSG